jgi:hypothetical protein
MKAHYFKEKYLNIDEIPDEAVPETWDWRNIDDYDFTSSLFNQWACGACYTASFIQNIESRIKIKYSKILHLSA